MILALVSVPPMRVRGYLAALPHVIKRNDVDKAYKVYMTESVKLYAEGKRLTVSFTDIIDPPPPPPPEDPRSCEEIVSAMWERINRGE